MVRRSKEPVDNSIHYKHTEQKLRDTIYNSIVRRYGSKGNRWEQSDSVVWGGFIYHVVDYFGYVILVWLLWWGYNLISKHQGEAHAIAFILILIFMRLTMILSAIRHSNRLLKGG